MCLSLLSSISLGFILLAVPVISNYVIDEGCCEMFIEEPNCLAHCISIINDENITQFNVKQFQCAPRQVQNKLVRCIVRSNYGLPVDRDVCCDKAQSDSCQDVCSIGTPSNDFNGKCDRNAEVSLYRCIDDYLHLKECCYSSATDFSCAASCNKAIDYGPNLRDWVDIRLNCDDNFPAVKECMTRYSENSTTSRYACCNKSDKEQCRFACDKGMSGEYTQADQLSALFDACGDPIQDKTWLCLMSEESAGISPLGELTAIQCCKKAFTSNCRNLCVGLYKDWFNSELWERFSSQCRYEPKEENMVNCILDVSEPCTLGCDHLTFCENLNNRPLDLFRTCSAKYDEGAERDYNKWVQEGFIMTPLVNITVINITQCQPHIWKSIACVLQTKPCHEKSHSNSICNNVCVSLLETCLDKALSRRTVQEICAILAPNDDPDHCINLHHYLVPGQEESRGKLTHPCQPSPCNASQQCVLNRNCANGDMYCTPYICQDSCSIGTLRDYQIEVGSWVRIPDSEGSDCYKVCTCDDKKKLSNCQKLQCYGTTDCKVGDRSYEHMSQFTYECNMCVCYSGIVTCTKRQCNTVESNPLPGGCDPFYSPVCGTNGASYHNPCIARQFNVKDSQFHYTSCDAVDVCVNAACDDNKVCRPERQTCLDFRKPCPQYTCESPTINCEGEDLEPVCDTDNVQHAHMCSLVQHQRTLAHKGYCVGSCNSTTGPVCGANARTYASECTAESDYMIVDYIGECQPPSDTEFSEGRYCSQEVQCRGVPDSCKAQRAPGMCCPVCGGVVALLPSQVLVTINEMYVTNSKLTVKLLCQKLHKLMSLSECKIGCTLGLYGDITALVSSTVNRPSWIQIEACNNEAIRLETMINIRHVRIQTDLVLSTVLGAETTPVLLDNNQRSAAPALAAPLFYPINYCSILVFISLVDMLLL